jgi:predicted RNase H-like HicB family nuclease
MLDRTTLWASVFQICPVAHPRAMIDEALRNAPEALQLYAESFEADGKPLPRPRTLTELKNDPEIADDIKTYMVALIEFPARAHAAE